MAEENTNVGGISGESSCERASVRQLDTSRARRRDTWTLPAHVGAGIGAAGRPTGAFAMERSASGASCRPHNLGGDQIL